MASTSPTVLSSFENSNDNLFNSSTKKSKDLEKTSVVEKSIE